MQETAFSGVFRYLANGTEHSKITKFEASGAWLLLVYLKYWLIRTGRSGRPSGRPCVPRAPARAWLAQLRTRHPPARAQQGPQSGGRWRQQCALAPRMRVPTGMARVGGEFYVVFDNAMALGHLDDRFGFRWGPPGTAARSAPRAAAPGWRWDGRRGVRLFEDAYSSLQGSPQRAHRTLGA